MRRYFKKRIEESRAALERIKILFALAKQDFKAHPERSHRYVEMILDIVKKVRVKLPSNIKRYICVNCKHLLVPGVNLKVRSDRGFMIYQCLDCGSIKKYGYIREKREKRINNN